MKRNYYKEAAEILRRGPRYRDMNEREGWWDVICNIARDNPSALVKACTPPRSQVADDIVEKLGCQFIPCIREFRLRTGDTLVDARDAIESALIRRYGPNWKKEN